MNENKIYIDDWNTIFRTIPKCINDHTYDIMCGTNYYVDLDNYASLKHRLSILMKCIGDFEYIIHATGDQTIINAIILSKKYLGVNRIYVAKEAFHGITLKSIREAVLSLEDITVIEFEMNRLDEITENGSDDSLLILEPFLFFSKQGYEGVMKLKIEVLKAKQNGMFILFDEIRSGAFSTGQFLFTQKFVPIDVDFICFSKGLALGVPTAVLSVKAGLIKKKSIKKEDRLKSCMSISEVAMQRANDLLEYYIDNSESFKERMAYITERIISNFLQFEKYLIVDQVNIMGLCCVFVFKNDVKKTLLKLLWTYMISKNIEVRHNEENIWFLSFALDSTEEELSAVKNTLEEAIELINW